MRRSFPPSAVVVCVILTVGCLLSACSRGEGISRGDDAEETYQIKFSHVQPPQTIKGQAAELFKREVERESSGAIKVQIFPNAELYDDDNEIQALQSGAIQMIAPSAPSYASIAPEVEVAELPFLFDTYREAEQAFQPTETVGETILSNDKLLKSKLRVLGPWPLGFRQFHSNTPVRRLQDLQGLRLRYSGGGVRLSALQAWDANPQEIASDEVYTALQQGVVNGGENTFDIILSDHWTEVQDYVTESNHGFTTYLLTINNEFFESLPKDLQDVVTAAAEKTVSFTFGQVEKIEAEARREIDDTGSTQVIRLTEAQREELKKAVVPKVYEEYADEMGQDVIDQLLADIDR